MRPSINAQIVDATSLISILLVFLFAFFAFLVPLIEDWRGRKSPIVVADLGDYLRRLRSFRVLAFGLAVVTILVLGLLGPLSWTSATTFPRSGSFPTLRWGLLVVDLLLVVTAATFIGEGVLLTLRIRRR